MSLPRDYEMAIKYPYHGIKREYLKEEMMALAILNDLNDRKGIKNELSAVDDDIKEDIVEALSNIIKYGLEDL